MANLTVKALEDKLTKVLEAQGDDIQSAMLDIVEIKEQLKETATWLAMSKEIAELKEEIARLQGQYKPSKQRFALDGDEIVSERMFATRMGLRLRALGIERAFVAPSGPDAYEVRNVWKEFRTLNAEQLKAKVQKAEARKQAGEPEQPETQAEEETVELAYEGS